MTRTLTTRKGMVVQTTLTDGDAIAICRTLPSAFAQDLATKAGKWGLSPDQLAWAHKLAMEKITPPAATEVKIGDLAGVLALFAKAGSHLKFPKVRLAVGDKSIRLSRCTHRSKHPGSIAVCLDDHDRTWLGRIHTDGSWVPSRTGQDFPGLVELLRRFAEEPAKVAAEYGRMLGACCFCCTPLSDERSTAVGYGETCAKHYGLHFPKAAEARAIHAADRRMVELELVEM